MQSYLDYGPTKDFFTRFNISTEPLSQVPVNTTYVDFTNGKIVGNYTPPGASARTTALAQYLELCELYEDIILPGYWDFPLPNNIPADLLLDFGDFARKHALEAAVPQIITISGLGVGTPLTTPTLYIMQAFGAPMGRALLTGSGFVPLSRYNSELYSRIAQLLRDDVLYSSKVVESERSIDGVNAAVKGANGELTLVQAKRILIAFEPTLENMKPLSLDEQEARVFTKWEYSNSYASIVTHPSLPINGALVNTPLAAAPSNYLVIPQLPYLSRFTYVGSPGFRALIGTNRTVSSIGAKKVVEDAFQELLE